MILVKTQFTFILYTEYQSQVSAPGPMDLLLKDLYCRYAQTTAGLGKGQRFADNKANFGILIIPVFLKVPVFSLFPTRFSWGVLLEVIKMQDCIVDC